MVIEINRGEPLEELLRQDIQNYLIDEVIRGWIVEEQDERSVSIIELDLSKVELVTVLSEKEKHTSGKEKLKRLKKRDYIRLDYRVLREMVIGNIIPEKWKEKMRQEDITKIFFDGTIFRDKKGKRYVSCIRICNNGMGFQWDFVDMSLDWFECHPSAVIIV